MTLSSTVNRTQYTGAGSVGPYTIPFRIFSADDLVVVKRVVASGTETELVNDTDFTVAGVGNSQSTLTLITALATGEILSIRRAPAMAQPTSVQNQGGYFAKTHEDEFDRLAMQLQSLQDQVNRSFGILESYAPAGKTLRIRPETGKVLAWQSDSELGNATLDSSATAIPGGGRTVATVSAYLLNNATLNVKDFGALGDGVANDSAAFQAAIDAGKSLKREIFVPAGTYKLVTGLTIYTGTRIRGEQQNGLFDGSGLNPKGSRLDFSPVVADSDLFTASSANGAGAGFREHISIVGLFIHGNDAANSRYCLNLGAVIYGRFAFLGIENFRTAIYCDSTINNRFENVAIAGADTGAVSCVDYAGNNETTDVWEQCTFTRSIVGGVLPKGIRFLGSALAIRFSRCIFEAITNYGAEIHGLCQNIMFDDCYSEDVPVSSTAGSAMFAVGKSATTLVTEQQLIVKGGKYTGLSGGVGVPIGSFLTTDYCNGVMLIGVNASRWATMITTTANTRVGSILVVGLVGIGYTTFMTDNLRVAGVYPTDVINPGMRFNGRFDGVEVVRLLDLSQGNVGGQVKFPALQNPSSDNNTLDDFERGDWTPSIGGTATYTAAVGRYLKVGKFVYVNFRIVINAIGTGSVTTLSGLPFTCANLGLGGGVPVHFFANLAAATIALLGSVAANAATMAFNGQAASGASMSGSVNVFANSAEIRGAGWYEAAN